MIDQKYKVAAGNHIGAKTVLLVQGTGNLLVARRGSTAPVAANQVDQAGGRAEPGESPWSTCRREVGEEIGVDIAEGVLLAADAYEVFEGSYIWMFLVDLPRGVARSASAVSEMSEVIEEGIDDYLQRDDAWIPFQLHAHKLLLTAGLTDLEPDYSRLTP